MKKMMERFLSLVVAVALAFSLGGVGTVLAATTTTYAVSLDSGNVSVTLEKNGTLTVRSGAGGATVKSGLNPALTVLSVRGGNTTARTITVNTPGSYAYVAISGATATLSVTPNSTVQLSAPVASRINGIVGGGTVSMNSGVLTIVGNTAGALAINGGTVTATAGTLGNVTVNGAAGLTAAAATSITKSGTGTATVTGSVANATVNGGTLAISGNATNVTVGGGTLTLGGAVAGTATVKGGTATIGGAIATANVTSGTLAARSTVKTATVGGGTLNATGTVASATVKGGVLNANGAVTTAAVSSGALNVTGAVSGLTLSGGTANLRNGASNVTVGGGKLTAAGTLSSITLNSGEAAVSGGIANAVINGGKLSYTGSAALGHVKMAGGELNLANANLLPSGAVITGGNLSLASKVKANPVISSTYTVKKVTGTYPTSLGLPKEAKANITGGLIGQKSIAVDIVWDFSRYDYDKTSTQTIYGTITPKAPFQNAVQLSNTRATARVTLSRPSIGNNNPDPSYNFWMNLRDDISSSNSGTITVNASKYDDMPTAVLEALKGKRITLVIERNGEKDIKINGMSMKSIPASQIFYKLSELASVYKNASTGTGNNTSMAEPEDPGSKPPTPSNGGGTTGGTGGGIGSGNRPSTPANGGGTTGGTGGATGGNTGSTTSSSSSSSSSSSEEESSSSEESSEPEESESEPEESEPDVPVDNEVEEEPEKKSINPIAVVAISAAVVALAAGIVAYIVMRRRQF